MTEFCKEGLEIVRPETYLAKRVAGNGVNSDIFSEELNQGRVNNDYNVKK